MTAIFMPTWGEHTYVIDSITYIYLTNLKMLHQQVAYSLHGYARFMPVQFLHKKAKAVPLFLKLKLNLKIKKLARFLQP